MLSLVGVGYVQGFGCAIILQDTAERGGQRRNQNTLWSGFSGANRFIWCNLGKM